MYPLKNTPQEPLRTPTSTKTEKRAGIGTHPSTAFSTMRALCALLLAGTHTRWAAGFYPQLSSTSYRFHAPNSQHCPLESPTHWVVTRWSFPRRRSAAAATITATVTTATTTTTTAGSSGSRSRYEATMSGGPLSRFRGAEASTTPAAAAAPRTRRRAASMRVRNARTSSSLRVASRSGSVEHARCFHEGEGSGGGDTAAAPPPSAGAETSSGVNGATTAVAAAPRLLLGEDYGDSTAVAHEYLREFLGMTDEVCIICTWKHSFFCWFEYSSSSIIRMFRRFWALLL